ncbi:MAG: hypothetical protein EPO16_08195 [Dehalococcoidia bacterium]|nr:MAG: hypothetical protein EPO16_08195 [Dehalococcoidia bacterium]
MSGSTSIRLIPLGELRPHPDNPNHMPASRLQKLVAHIRKSGQYEPLIVRTHPTDEKLYQILNGHHRAQALRALGHDRAACIVWQASDHEARLYLATLNQLAGTDIPEKRAALLDLLLQEVVVQDLAALLPESTDELQELADLSASSPDFHEPSFRDEDRIAMRFLMDPEEAAVISAAFTAHQHVDRAASPTASLVAIAKHYLSSGAEVAHAR